MNEVDRLVSGGVSVVAQAEGPEAASALCAGAPAAPQARLDLSLGHFGKQDEEFEVDVVSYGPYVVTLDYGALVAVVGEVAGAHCSRAERRESERKVATLLKTARKSGMYVVREGAA